MHQGNPSSKTGLKVPIFVSKTPEFDTFFAQTGFECKEAVSVSIMAKMVGLSRARFYQLIGTAFPHPVYNVETRRPYYLEEMQKTCLEVRHRNCGIDGKPILFYARHAPKAVPKKPKVQNLNVWIIEGLKSLGFVANSAQVEAAIKSVFPRGIDHVEQGEVIRSVFIHLKSKVA